MIYRNASFSEVTIPNVDLLTFLFESRHSAATETTPLHAEASSPDTAFTKSDVRIISQQISYWLRENYKLTSEDVVAVFSNGQAALPFLFYGIVGASGVYSAASTFLSAEELAMQVRDGPCKVLVCSEDVEETALAAGELAGLPKRNILVLRTTPTVSLAAADGSASYFYGRGQSTRRLPWEIITDPDVLATTAICLVYTSGTTGRPKGVRISHANMVSEALLPASINRPIWDKWRVGGKPFECRTIAHLGCAHISGVQGYFVNPFFDGGIVYWMPRFDMMAFLKYNAMLKITTFFSLPRVYAAAAFHPAVTDQLASLRIAYSGGWPLDPRVYESSKLGGDGDDRALLSQTWGATETTGATTHMPPDRRDKTGSVGVLLPNMQLRLVNENGLDVNSGEPGEAWLKGPVITSGYHNNDKANTIAFEDGWYRTGDLVQMHGDLIYVLGRVKEIVNYQGSYVSPAEIEAILIQYPGVADAAVLGVPDERERTEVPQALVALGPNIEGNKSLAQDIAMFVDDKVADHKRLRGGVRFVQAIPRLVTGKMCRDKLPGLLVN